jgi:hypothetical protein
MKELWEKLGVKASLSTAFHPQTDGETERVNQEIEQFFRVFCNFQQNNWVDLLPFAEFAHNVRAHSATGQSPFQVWYGFQPEFIPPSTSPHTSLLWKIASRPWIKSVVKSLRPYKLPPKS